MERYDYVVIGGGIVGLATALALSRRNPQARLLVLEKEADWALHQTGHNSGVIHSGIYYKPGSMKARLSRAGNQGMVAFCREHAIPHDVCGKVIVATSEAELPLMERLAQRGEENGIEIERLKPEQVSELEPHVRSLGGLKVPSTGIVDFRRVCLKYVDLIRETGGELRLKSQVIGIQAQTDFQAVETTSGAVEAKCLVNCAGLHCDRVARLAGLRPPAKIVPFRGEYYELAPSRRSLVKNLIYPVPNPDFPFLGVHFTRMIDGSVHAGPNAVLSFKREGYHRTDVNLRDFTEVMAYAGFWKMVVKNGREGMKEIVRSFSKKAFVRSLQTLIPEVRAADVVPSEAGVRAQALQADGTLVDDFLILHAPRAVHVLNAPSPAATASLEIGQAIVAEVPEV